MNLLDIIVVSAIAITGIIGLKNGLVKSLVKLIGGLLAVLLAYLLCASAVQLVSELIIIEDLPLNQYIATSLEQQMAEGFIGIPGNENIFTVVPEGGYTESLVAEALTANGVPQILSGLLAPVIMGLVQGSSLSLATYASVALTGILMSALSFLLLFIIISVLLGLLTKLIDKIVNLPIIGIANRLGGMLFGMLKTVLIIWVVLFFASLLGVVSGPVGDLIDSTVVVKFLAEYNPLTSLVANGLDFDKTIADLMQGLQNRG
jgi:uncharacterized membrane protein required for colicin V production